MVASSNYFERLGKQASEECTPALKRSMDTYVVILDAFMVAGGRGRAGMLGLFDFQSVPIRVAYIGYPLSHCDCHPHAALTSIATFVSSST
jgi:hypothetical protein